MNNTVIIEKDLTPENAHTKNLIWIKDIIVDSEAPKEAFKDTAKYLKDGYKLGQCASTASENNFVGLYKKITVE